MCAVGDGRELRKGAGALFTIKLVTYKVWMIKVCGLSVSQGEARIRERYFVSATLVLII